MGDKQDDKSSFIMIEAMTYCDPGLSMVLCEYLSVGDLIGSWSGFSCRHTSNTRLDDLGTPCCSRSIHMICFSRRDVSLF